MGKFVGFKCDMCTTTENGDQRPGWWIVVKLPSTGEDATKDICSDKCLLKFARERNSGGTTTPKASDNESKPRKKVDPSNGLHAFMDENGVRPMMRGVLVSAHVRGRHEMTGAKDDCLVCVFEGAKDVDAEEEKA